MRSRYCAFVLHAEDYLVQTWHASTRPAALDSARQAWPERRLVVIFQPHRFTRTRDLYEDFVNVLSSCDVLLLLDVYTAGEEPIAGADGRSLSRSIRQRGAVDPVFVEQVDEIPSVLAGIIRDGDVVLTQGAGNVAALAQELRQHSFTGGAP